MFFFALVYMAGQFVYTSAMPPSTFSSMPVMNLESSEARNKTAAAISSACPILRNGTCGNDTACQTITATTTTGVTSATSGLNNISIYPNPATEELNITGVSETSAYSIYNVTGAAMQQGVLNVGANSVPLHGYAPGIYILDITGSDGSRIITRVVKQ